VDYSYWTIYVVWNFVGS